MRIDSLYISNHKNFENFNINFNEEFYINILLGRNGTGKSNIIEVIVSIFQQLEKAKTPKEIFEYINFDFEIRYFTIFKGEQNWLLISKINLDFKVIQSENKEGLEDKNRIFFSVLKRQPEDSYLPKYVIGYYSGLSDRLREVFKPNEESYYKLVKQNKDQDLDFRRFFYADNHHCQLLLLSLLAFAQKDEKISDLLTDFLNFEELVDFTITFKSPDWNKGVSLRDGLDRFWGANGTPFRFCNFILSESEGEPIIDFNSKLEIDNKIRESITFYLNGSKFINNAAEYYETGINLFRHLESTFISGLINEIVIRVKKKNSNDAIQFKELSEGEQQLITIIGLLIFTTQNNTLFLLDEPDTHLNPNWQRDYIKLFNDFSEAKNNHIIMATHSPLLVQAADDAGIILIETVDGKPHANAETRFIENWRIDQVLTSEYFGLVSARPPQLDDFMKLRETLLNKEILTEEDLSQLELWETDSGLLPSGETINDFNAMHLVRTIANEIKRND